MLQITNNNNNNKKYVSGCGCDSGEKGDESKFYGYLSLIGGSLMRFTIGSFYSSGNLVPYFASYFANIELQQKQSTDHPLSVHQIQDIYNEQTANTNWIFFVFLTTFGFGVYIGGYLEIKLGVIKALIISSLLISFGVGLTFFSLTYGGSDALYLCVFTIGILWGTGLGIGNPTLVVVGMRWFPKSKGFVSGLVSSYSGMGALIFTYLQSLFVNPSNIEFDDKLGYVEEPDILANIPLMCIYMALIMAGMQIISILSVRNPSWFATGDNNNNKKNIVVGEQAEYEKYSLTAPQALHFGSFWVLFVLNFFYSLVSAVVFLQWKVFAINGLGILDDQYLTVVGSISALFMAFGRIFWGLFYDFSGQSYIVTQCSMSVIITVFICTWPLCSYAPMVMFPIWNFVIWFNINANFSIYPSVISRAFGPKFVGPILGCILFSEMFSMLFVVCIVPKIYLWFGGWSSYLLMIGAFGVSTVLLPYIFQPEIDRKQYLMRMPGSEKKRLMDSTRIFSTYL